MNQLTPSDQLLTCLSVAVFFIAIILLKVMLSHNELARYAKELKDEIDNLRNQLLG